MQFFESENIYTLKDAVDTATNAVRQAFPDRFWIVAEIASINSSRGHVYIDLVQKDPASGSVLAKTKAMVWQYSVKTVLGGFASGTGMTLEAGMNALMCVTASLHAVYGLGFQIHAIDCDFSLGEMARRKRETIERLEREGLTELNKDLALPVVAQRIAVISSSTAAGYEDFAHQLAANPGGYRFRHMLFEAAVQGDDAERSLIAALHQARALAEYFDVVIIIRGGGSKTDLHCFDSYALAREMATFPLPVITGIGHERDDSVADLVAHTRCKTPTAVAEFLLRGAMEFESHLIELQMRVARAASARLEIDRHTLDTAAHRLQAGVIQAVRCESQSLQTAAERVRTGALLQVERERGLIERAGDKVALLDPANILRRGYSLVRLAESGKLVRSVEDVRAGDTIEIQVANGSASATVGGTQAQSMIEEKEPSSSAV